MKTMTIRAQRTKQALFFLPVLIAPFLCLAFWVAGGGQGEQPVHASNSTGLNLKLPDPFFGSSKELDKWAYYSQEDALAKKEEAAKRKEGYWETSSAREVEEDGFPVSAVRSTSKVSPPKTPKKSIRPITSPAQQSDALYKKLEALEATLKASEVELDADPMPSPVMVSRTAEMEQLTGLMDELQAQSNAPDPEMAQLDGMLDKILQIQKSGWSSEPIGPPFAPVEIERVSSELVSPSFSPNQLIEASALEDASHFYGLSEETPLNGPVPIQAMVYGDQVVVPGSTVELLLLDSLQVGGVWVPAFSSLYGTTSLQGDRLLIAGKAILSGKQWLTVSWQVLDMDGITGVMVPSSLTRESLRQSAGQTVQGLDVMGSVSPSLSVQAATAGIQAAKTMLTKRTRQVKLTLPASYRVWIQLK